MQTASSFQVQCYRCKNEDPKQDCSNITVRNFNQKLVNLIISEISFLKNQNKSIFYCKTDTTSFFLKVNNLFLSKD